MSEPAATGGRPPDSIDAVKDEIERTRRELADTVDDLADRMNVKAQVRRRADSITHDVAARTGPHRDKIAVGVGAAVVIALVVRQLRRRRRQS